MENRTARLVERDGALVADNATVVGDVTLGVGVSIWYGAVVRGDIAAITIGEWTNIQDGCVLHCDPGLDLVVGRRVTVGHGAVVHASRVGDECLIGIGAILLAGAKIGEGSIVAAGAVVKEHEEVPPGAIVAGVPAKVIGEVTEEMKKRFEVGCTGYVKLAEIYRLAIP